MEITVTHKKKGAEEKKRCHTMTHIRTHTSTYTDLYDDRHNDTHSDTRNATRTIHTIHKRNIHPK